MRVGIGQARRCGPVRAKPQAVVACTSGRHARSSRCCAPSWHAACSALWSCRRRSWRNQNSTVFMRSLPGWRLLAPNPAAAFGVSSPHPHTWAHFLRQAKGRPPDTRRAFRAGRVCGAWQQALVGGVCAGVRHPDQGTLVSPPSSTHDDGGARAGSSCLSRQNPGVAGIRPQHQGPAVIGVECSHVVAAIERAKKRTPWAGRWWGHQ